MIQVTFQFDNLQDLHDFTAKMAVPVPLAPAVAVAALEPALTPKVRGRKPAAPVPVDTPVHESPEAAHAAVAKEVVEKLNPPDLDAVRKAVMKVNDDFGLVPARRVLKKFNVARVTELKPEQYADFIKACGEVK